MSCGLKDIFKNAPCTNAHDVTDLLIMGWLKIQKLKYKVKKFLTCASDNTF